MKTTNYFVLPSVVPAGQVSEIRIIPRAEQGRFDNRFVTRSWGEVAPRVRFPEEWFTHDSEASCAVRITAYRDCYRPETFEGWDEMTVKVDLDGGLTIKYEFGIEQEYLIRVSDPLNHDDFRYTFSVYAVESDLYGKRAYKGDLHVHTIYSDGIESIEDNIAYYRSCGYDFLSLTDHFKRFPSVIMKEITDNHDFFGLNVYHGEEVHVPDIKFHYVHVGGVYSVNEWFEDNKEEYERQYKELYDSISIDDDSAHDFAARLAWIHKANKKAGGMSIYAHPHWHWCAQNMPDCVSDYIFENGLMDAFELLGGQTIGENNTQVALWQEYGMKGKRYPVVSSSDSHSVAGGGGAFNKLFTVVFADNPSLESVAAAILKNENVAVERIDQTRAYGSLRYVFFMQYLSRNYFPIYEELCNNIGSFIKMYFEGFEGAAQGIKTAQKYADTFAEKFFGRQK